MRVSRQWNDMKLRKWSGFGHSENELTQGKMCLFCATCPQPGVNLSEGWEAAHPEGAYTRGIVLDGNFEADHLKMRRPDDDIFLFDGACFITELLKYNDYISKTTEAKQVSCAQFSLIIPLTDMATAIAEVHLSQL